MMTKDEFKMLSNEIEEVLQKVGDKYGVDISGGNIRYSNIDATMQLKLAKKLVDGKPYEQAEFEKYCYQYGLTPNDYKRKIEANGTTYVLIGLNPKAPKYPLLVENEENKCYKMALDALRR